jgi:hypothetical protein
VHANAYQDTEPNNKAHTHIYIYIYNYFSSVIFIERREDNNLTNVASLYSASHGQAEPVLGPTPKLAGSRYVILSASGVCLLVGSCVQLTSQPCSPIEIVMRSFVLCDVHFCDIVTTLD